jgi:hypothetical protein
MIYNKQNYGFCLQLQTELTYRSIGFNGANAPDSLAAKRPKLIVKYTTR